LAGWLALSRWLVPSLIADAYREESLPFLNRLISGRAVHSLGHYLESWERLARPLTFGLVASGGLLYAALVLGLARTAGRHFTRSMRWTHEFLRSRPAMRLGTLVLAAFAIGLAAGFVEVLYLLAKKTVLNQAVMTTTDADLMIVWMAPIAYALLFMGLALLLRIVAMRWPSACSIETVVFSLCAIGAYGILRSGEHIHGTAAAILALGLGAVAARVFSDRALALHAWGVRATPSLGGLTLAVALAGAGLDRWTETRPPGALSEPPENAPNVLLIILDTVRARNLSVYGYVRPTTPRLERWAAKGVVFERAIAPSPWTLPTHASLFTGRYPYELSADWSTPLDDTDPVLAEVLGRQGYATAAFVANLFYGARQFGLDRGFGRYEVMPLSLGSLLSSSWVTREATSWVRRRLGLRQTLVRKRAEELNESFLAWLDRRDDRPFLAFLNYYDAHEPYLPPEPYNLSFADEQPIYWLDGQRRYQPHQLAELTTAYDGTLAYLDAQVGALLDSLEARGELDRTVVIITSDHGEEFGEHDGVMGHGGSLFMPALRVPLIVLYPPRIPGGHRVREAVSLRDVPATILDFIGFEGGTPLPGTSLASCWAEGEDGCRTSTVLLSEVSEAPWERPSWVPAAKGPLRSLIVDGLHYIQDGDGTESLYDLHADPEETVDLSKSDAGVMMLPRLRNLLAGFDTGDRRFGKGN
jgi:arylsulfatase A-like enzyme